MDPDIQQFTQIDEMKDQELQDLKTQALKEIAEWEDNIKRVNGIKTDDKKSSAAQSEATAEREQIEVVKAFSNKNTKITATEVVPAEVQPVKKIEEPKHLEQVPTQSEKEMK